MKQPTYRMIAILLGTCLLTLATPRQNVCRAQAAHPQVSRLQEYVPLLYARNIGKKLQPSNVIHLRLSGYGFGEKTFLKPVLVKDRKVINSLIQALRHAEIPKENAGAGFPAHFNCSVHFDLKKAISFYGKDVEITFIAAAADIELGPMFARAVKPYLLNQKTGEK